MFRRLPPFGGDQRAVAEIVNGIMDGKTNNTGTITLNSGSTSTTLTDARIGAESVIIMTPMTSNAAKEFSTCYVSARTNGSATLTHQNTGHSDLDYTYIVVG
jgi:hypothetical protein